MNLKPPEANSSGIAKDYFNLFQDEMGYISDIEKNLMNKEPKYDTMQSLTKRKGEELEQKCSRISEDHMDQVQDRDMKRRIKKRMKTVLEEGKLVESEYDLTLYKQKNENWKDKFKKRRRFENLEEGELSENTQRLARLTILEPNPQNKMRNEFQDFYEQLCCFSNISLLKPTDLFDQNEERTFRLTNEIQNENDMQPNILEHEEEEDYLMLPIITF
ncbi:hypothetical protein O181_030195 [Austropuccinia psidii MF-1]|uniref:Uncharacterized protein n=1 Tax=Austropuccinia psidii MF-1 TaxID=1389203 RepID=A0A9Q3H5Z5_9BASI|nr:hypothetical protein [Austropuccinia psidii MF-1]